MFLTGLCTQAIGQSPTPSFSYFPHDVIFAPLLANHDEPSLSAQQEIGASILKLGIGNMMDIIEYRDGNSRIRFGADVFVYVRSNTIRGTLLKIDAADGYFGVHFAYHDGSPFRIRFRIFHFSAHLVDGNYNEDTGTWDPSNTPIPFSRNYGEILGAYDWDLTSVSIKAYAGLSYAPVVKPADIRPFATLGGVELRRTGSPNIYAAYNFTLLGVPRYIGSNTAEVGVRLGRWDDHGFRMYLNYFGGLDPFGQYYNVYRRIWSIGIALDSW